MLTNSITFNRITTPIIASNRMPHNGPVSSRGRELTIATHPCQLGYAILPHSLPRLFKRDSVLIHETFQGSPEKSGSKRSPSSDTLLEAYGFTLTYFSLHI